MNGEDAVVAQAHSLSCITTAIAVIHFENIFPMLTSPFRPDASLSFLRDLCYTSCIHGVPLRRTEWTYPAVASYGRHGSSML